MPKSPIAETNNRYAICVGINQYHSSAQVKTLRYAEKDAQALYDLLLRHGFARDNCHLLLGNDATLEAIQDALTSFVLTKPYEDDLVIFYFAGHGLPISLPDRQNEFKMRSEAFLLSYDFDRRAIENKRGLWLAYALRMGRLRSDFFEATLSKKVLFIFDSCHSGDFYGSNYRDDEVLAHEYVERTFGGCSAGRIVLSSCMPQQKAREDEKLEHGLFTYHLLDVLAGNVPRAIQADGWVTVGSLFDYLSNTLPIDQRPVRSGVEHGS